VYMCGVFFSRIYVADSRRDSVFTYFGKRGVTTTLYCKNEKRREARIDRKKRETDLKLAIYASCPIDTNSCSLWQFLPHPHPGLLLFANHRCEG